MVLNDLSKKITSASQKNPRYKGYNDFTKTVFVSVAEKK